MAARRNPIHPVQRKIQGGTLCWAKPTSRTASAKRYESTAENGRSIMWRTTIRQSSMRIPSPRCRRNWQDEPQSARSSRLARLPSKANTAESMHSPSCSSAENAERPTADAHGHPAVKRESCGGASIVSTTERNTATTLRRWRKLHYRKPL